MPYLGNPPADRFTTTTVDTFNGNNSTTEFTLSRTATTNDVEVLVENVQQQPTTAYSISGTTLTFTSAPPTGTGNIYVIHRGAAISSVTPANGTVSVAMLSATGTKSGSTFLAGDNSFKTVAVTPTAVSDQANSSTGFFALPSGTTAQRPGSPAEGYTRYNTDQDKVEVYANGNWETFTSNIVYDVQYLVIAGGGGGAGNATGGSSGGGGGAGGYLTTTGYKLSVGTLYTVTVGAGGAAGSIGANGTKGQDSLFEGVLAVGGGAGGYTLTAGNGGSGGGSMYAATPGGSGTSGQGFDGGVGSPDNLSGGGGGGASEDGLDASNSVGGDGGDGLSSSITGSAVTRAGGGGGGSYNTGTRGAGGAGGGGTGANGSNAATAGTANTGGGGGGGARTVGGSGVASAAGGSGVVILRMATANYSGTTTGSPTVTTDGSDTVLTFTSSGTYTA